MRVNIPAAPVDRYAVTRYYVRGTDWTVATERAVYYADASYEEVTDQSERSGAPFVNQWGVFHETDDGGWRLVGRVDPGWEMIRSWLPRESPGSMMTTKFATREAAEAHLRERLRRRRLFLRDQLALVERRLQDQLARVERRFQDQLARVERRLREIVSDAEDECECGHRREDHGPEGCGEARCACPSFEAQP